MEGIAQVGLGGLLAGLGAVLAAIAAVEGNKGNIPKAVWFMVQAGGAGAIAALSFSQGLTQMIVAAMGGA